MKKFYQWVLAATLTCGLMTLTSCQGLVDAIFGEDAQPAESSKPSTEPEKYDAKTTPLTLKALVANAVVHIDLMDELKLSSVEYSTDGKTWTALSSYHQEIKLAAVGDKVMLRGSNGSYATADKYTRIYCTSAAATRGEGMDLAICQLVGNIMSLIEKEGFSSIDDLRENYTFRRLFNESGVDCEPDEILHLVSGKLTTGCFEETFKGNTCMKVAPRLEADELVDRCYVGTFEDCSNVSAVVMLATKVAEGTTIDACVKNMVNNAGKESGKENVIFVDKDSKIDVEEVKAAAGGWKVKKVESSLNINYEELGKIDDAELLDEPDETEDDIIAGSNTPLVTEGFAFDGTIKYAVTDDRTKPTSTEGFSAQVPTAEKLEAGTYYVWYYVEGDVNHFDTEITGPIEVTVKAATKPAAKVTTAPTAKTVTTSSAGADYIINAGTTSEGTLKYALTANNSQPNDDQFSEKVPTVADMKAALEGEGFEFGSKVYVWYKVSGDDTHSDSEIAGPIEVTVTDAND